MFILGGAMLGAGVLYGTVRLSGTESAEPPRERIVVDRDRTPDDDGAVDPAMVANANLTESLEQCSQRLAILSDQKDFLAQQFEAAREAEADASRSAQARRLSRRDPSAADWRRMASTGTVRYLLPCASFRPSPDVLDRLGLAPPDVPVVQNAFAAARATAWTAVRPLCMAAVGSVSTADRLGLDACPQVILDTARATDPGGADSAMHVVGAIRAGVADPSALRPDDAVGTTFLALTGVARDAESRLAAALGSEDARAIVYGNNGCGRTVELTVPAPVGDP
jgi:hypothetical protein